MPPRTLTAQWPCVSRPSRVRVGRTPYCLRSAAAPPATRSSARAPPAAIAPARDCPHRADGPGRPPRPRTVRMTAFMQSRFRSATADPRHWPPLWNRDWRAAPATGYRNHAVRLLRSQPQRQPGNRTLAPTVTTRYGLSQTHSTPTHTHNHRSRPAQPPTRSTNALVNRGVSAAHGAGKSPVMPFVTPTLLPRSRRSPLRSGNCSAPSKTGASGTAYRSSQSHFRVRHAVYPGNQPRNHIN